LGSFSLPCGSIICAACALFVLATTLSCFLDILQMVLNKFSLRNVLYVIAVSVVCLLDATISEYYPQFTFGFVMTIVLHMICFLESFFVVFSVSPDERTVAQEKRWPSLTESNWEALDRMTELLGSSSNIVLYVGEDLVKESSNGQFSLSDLSIFNCRRAWKLAPGLAMKKFRNVLLTPIASVQGPFEGEADLYKFVEAITNSNARRVNVITECVDGKLQLPPSVGVIELRGNVTQMECPNGHAKIVSAQEQIDHPENLMCDECGQPLRPSICLGNEFDGAAVNAALSDIQGMQTPNDVILVLGQCRCPDVKKIIQSVHDNGVPLMQISRRLNFKDANVSLRASTRGTLVQLWDWEDDYPFDDGDFAEDDD